jgi:hypothetical protein
MRSLKIALLPFVLAFSLPVAPAIAEQKVVKKEWAILTFLNGFNNLDGYGSLDMNEMETVGSTDRVHVISQWASLRTRKAKRIYIKKDNDTSNVTSPVVEDLGQADMGDYRTLVDFVKWAAKNYPAKHYLVNIWNHGNGWHFNGEGAPTRDVSYDDLSGNKITTEQLGLAAEEISREIGQKIDIMSSDSCLMAMAEVVGEMKNNIGHFIGSQEVEPADGWPYDTLLTKWNEGGEKSPTDVAKILTRVYAESYPSGDGITLSGMDMAEYPTLASAVRELGDSIRMQTTEGRNRIRNAVAQTQSYSHDDYKDLGDFISQIEADKSIQIRPEVLLAVKAAVGKFISANHTSEDQARSHGVSIWLPDTQWRFDTYKERYRGLKFNQDTSWIDAIQATLASTGLTS